jgi:hypothetical protein
MGQLDRRLRRFQPLERRRLAFDLGADMIGHTQEPAPHAGLDAQLLRQRRSGVARAHPFDIRFSVQTIKPFWRRVRFIQPEG